MTVAKGRKLWEATHPRPAPETAPDADTDAPAEDTTTSSRNPWRERRTPPQWQPGNDAA